MTKRLLISSILFIVPSYLLAQDLKMSNEVTNYGNEKMTTASTMYLTPSNLKTRSKNSNGQETGSIYKKEEEVMYSIDHTNERYTEITKENIEQMEKMMERMKNLPESSKQMIGDKLDNMMQNEQPDISYSKTGKTKKVKPWGSCQEWKGVDEDGDLYNRVYTTSRNDVKVRQEHFDVLTSMIDFFSFMPEGADRNIPVNKGQKNELEGFGVLWIYYDDDGKKTQRVHVKEMKETSIDASEFEPPKDYEGNEMNMGGGARR
jgi:hypothetical protein